MSMNANIKSKGILSVLMLSVIMTIFVAVFSLSALAVDNIVILPSTMQLSAAPGSTISGSFVIENRGDAAGSGFVQFSGFVLTHATATSKTISISYLDAANTQNGTNTTIPFSIVVPANQYSGLYSGTLTATKGTSTSTVAFQVNVNATPQAATLQSVSIGTAAQPAVVGNAVRATSTLTNTGNTDISSVSITISDLTSGSNTIQSSSIQVNNAAGTATIAPLNYGGLSTVTMSLTPAATLPSGTYTGNLNAYFGTTRVQAPVTIYLAAPNNALTVSSSSITWSKIPTNTQMTSTVIVTNTGNTNLTPVTVTYPTSICGGTLAANPTSFDIAAGASKTITLTVSNIPSTQPSQTCSATITATAGTTTNSGVLSVVVRDPTYSISVPSKIRLASGSTVQRNTTQTATFDITNDGSYENAIELSSSALPDYSLTLSETRFTLAAGSTKTITITSQVPATQSSGDQKLADINIKYSTGLTSTTVKIVPLNVNTESRLSIYKVAGKVGTGSSDTVKNGDDINDDARPGDSFQIEVTARNLYSKGSDIDIDDIEITVTVENLDDGSDEDKTAPDFRLRADTKNSPAKVLSFKVPEDSDENSYSIKVEVEGTDDNGATHYDRWTVYLDVEKKEHDIRITTFDFINNNLACTDRTASLRVHVENRGNSYENDAAILVNQTQLGVTIFDTFELDNEIGEDDSEFEKTYTVLLPSNIAPGQYQFTMWVYYDEDIPFDYKQTTLTVQSCNAGSTTSGSSSGTGSASGGVISGGSTTGGQISSGQTSGSGSTTVISAGGTPDQSAVIIVPNSGSTQGSTGGEAVATPVSFSKTTMYLVLLGLGILLVVGLIVAMLFSMRRN